MSKELEITLYKIYHPEYDLYSKGGTRCHFGKSCLTWSKKGKSWSSSGAMRRHLNLYTFQQSYNSPIQISIPKEWQVIEIIANETGIKKNIYNAREFYEKKHLHVEETNV